MDASLETLVTAACVFACSLSISRCGPRGKVTAQELIAGGSVRLACGALLGCANCAARASSPARPPTATARPGAAGAGARACCSSATAGARRLACDLRPADEDEREGVFALAGAHPAGSLLFADAGHRGREHHESLGLVGVELIVPDKHRLGERPPAEINKARIHLVIESVSATLKRQMRMEDHLAKTLPGRPHGSCSDCWP